MAGKVALDIPRDVLIEQTVALATQAAIAHHEGRIGEAETHMNGLALLMHGLDDWDAQAIMNWLLASEEVRIRTDENKHWLSMMKKAVKLIVSGPTKPVEEIEERAAEMGLKPTGYVLPKFY